MRTYTSPEEIDAQMKAEKERKKVSDEENTQFLQSGFTPVEQTLFPLRVIIYDQVNKYLAR